MKIIVCVKQVPATTEVETDPKTGTLKRAGLASVINPFDLYAIEEAVRLRERHGGKVIALSMGPPAGAFALKDAIALGVDEAILMSDRAFAGADTVATAYTLAKGIEYAKGADIILCGVKTVDGDTAQVGPMLAEELGIPAVCNARRIQYKKDVFTFERVMDDGHETLRAKKPVLATVIKEINEPRMPTLEQKLKSKKAKVKAISTKDITFDDCMIGLQGSPTQVVRIFTPEKRSSGELLRLTPPESAQKMLERLDELGVLG
jgi:electron transfer flavoprotein beta subunit